MTRNQKMAVEILEMLDSKIRAEVGYYTGNDSMVFAWGHENKKIKTIDIEKDDAEAQEKFDEIKSIIEELKHDADE